MRIDHHAYQQATRVAGFGLLLQLIIGLTLLIFGLLGDDTTFIFGSTYVLLGSLVWLSLIIVFNQHKMERLEALEEDELASTRGEARSVFDDNEDELRVAARRLRLMHKWVLPIVSLFMAAMLVLFGWRILIFLDRVGETEEFHVTAHLGWAIAVCLGLAVLAFIFSRFVAGMAKQPAWQNLRGGAAWMVGNALVLLAIAVGIAFNFFENDAVLRQGVAYALPIFMFFVAAEIALNFVLNLYRPRIPGEVPRPAFDSKLLSLLAAPDNLVRSINEAVNYQFGFDITSSWGYQLMLRSFLGLIALGLIVLVLLNVMVIVEPHQQAIRLAGGEIVGGVHDSGVLFKAPWPFNTAHVESVTRVRELPLTARVEFTRRQEDGRELRLWSAEMQTDVELHPFIVEAAGAASLLDRDEAAAVDAMATEGEEPVSEADRRVSRAYALVDAEIVLQYRIESTKTGADEDKLIEFLSFSTDERRPRQPLTEREQVIKALALREITLEFAKLSLEEVLAMNRADLGRTFANRVQASLDRHQAGVEVVDVLVPTLRPADTAANAFAQLAVSSQAQRQMVTEARGRAQVGLRQLAGDADVEAVLEAIREFNRRRNEFGPEAPETVEAMIAAEQLLVDGAGQAAQPIIQAERDRWIQHMTEVRRAGLVASELPLFRAAPELYRQRRLMDVLTSAMAPVGVRKYILDIDPSRVNIDYVIEQLDTLLQFQDALESEGDMGG